jgi:hypothetical protein
MNITFARRIEGYDSREFGPTMEGSVMRKFGRYMATAEDRQILRKWTCGVMIFYCTLIVGLVGVSTVLRSPSDESLKSQAVAAQSVVGPVIDASY